MVCEEDWEMRHPQDLLRVQREQISVPFARPYPAQDTYIPETLWTKSTDTFGYNEQLAFNVKKYIFNVPFSESVLNGAKLNLYALNATDISSPKTETTSLTEKFSITIGRFFNESLALTETIKATVNHSIIENVPLGETKYFTETEHTLESLGFTEVLATSLNKGIVETLFITEILSKKASSVLSDTLVLAEYITKQDNEKTIESMTIAETRIAAVGKKINENLSVVESLSFVLPSGLALNGANLNKYSLG